MQWKLAVLIALLVVIVATSLYLSPKSFNPADSVQPTQNFSSDNWQVYKNEQYGIQFEYPEDWYVGGGLRESQFLLCLNPKGSGGDCPVIFTISWGVDLNERYSKIKNLFKERSVTESTTSVAGVPAKYFEVSGYPDGAEGYVKEFFFEKNGFVFNIAGLATTDDVLQRLLATLAIK